MNFPVHVDTGQQGKEERRAHSCRTAAPAAPFMAPAHDAKSINAKEAHVEATMATNCSRARSHGPSGTMLLPVQSWAKGPRTYKRIAASPPELLNFLEELEVPPSVAVHRKAEEQEGEYAANKIMIAARITTSMGGQLRRE